MDKNELATKLWELTEIISDDPGEIFNVHIRKAALKTLQEAALVIESISK